MKATELLKKQHKEVRDLFKSLESEDEGDGRRGQSGHATLVVEESCKKEIRAHSYERLSPFRSSFGLGGTSKSRRRYVQC